MEQASGSIMTDTVCVCCGPLLLFLWLFDLFQENTGVSYCLDYVENIYDDGGLLRSFFNP